MKSETATGTARETLRKAAGAARSTIEAAAETARETLATAAGQARPRDALEEAGGSANKALVPPAGQWLVDWGRAVRGQGG